LQKILREEWGFDGVVISDCVDIIKLYKLFGEQHNVAQSPGEAARLALTAGVDMELAAGSTSEETALRTYSLALAEEVAAGRIALDVIDRAVARVLRLKYRLGLFAEAISPLQDYHVASAESLPDDADHFAHEIWYKLVQDGNLHKFSHAIPRENFQHVLQDPAHDALALEAAEKAVILLKNEGHLLPLDLSRLHTIAVIGPLADVPALGGYSTPAPKYAITALNGIQRYVGDTATVRYAQGCQLENDSPEQLPEAVAVAQQADVALVVVGTTSANMGENNDRDHLELIGGQQALIEAVYATGTPTVVILLNGGPLAIRWVAEHVPAILEGWYLGQETGTALARVLFGAVNPGGKLPVTIPCHVGQVPCYYNHYMFGGIRQYYQSTFRHLYPFGYGLSYTSFAYSGLTISPGEIAPDESACVSITVTNTGDRAGDEVVQLYVTDAFASQNRPVKELKGFQRITLLPGENCTVTFTVGFNELRYWRDDRWLVEPGEFLLTLGPDSEHGDTISLLVH
jgi:beta-glucosidase